MNINNKQLAYHVAFNTYLDGIRDLLKTYSLRELVAKFPAIEWKHIRLASETAHMQYNPQLDVYCVYELKDMTAKERKQWLRRLANKPISPSALRKAIRRHNRRTTEQPIEVNKAKRNEWLIQLKRAQMTLQQSDTLSATT